MESPNRATDRVTRRDVGELSLVGFDGVASGKRGHATRRRNAWASGTHDNAWHLGPAVVHRRTRGKGSGNAGCDALLGIVGQIEELRNRHRGQYADDDDGDDQFDQREALVGPFPDFRMHAYAPM